MFSLLIILLILISSVPAHSELTLNNLDVSGYPAVKGSFYYFNNTSFPIYNLEKDATEIFDNGVKAEITGFNVPLSQDITNISLNMFVDLSTTDNASTGNHFLLAKKFVETLVNLMPETAGEMALMSFDKIPYLNYNFTNNKDMLLNALQSLTHQSTSAIENAFTAVPGGALDITARGENSKSIVFFSDENKIIDVKQIIPLARNAGIKINCVTSDKYAGEYLRALADSTGGMLIENMNAKNMQAYAKALLAYARNYKPIEISWNNNLDCETNHEILAVANSADTCRIEMEVKDAQKPTLQIAPSYLRFGALIPGNTKDLAIDLTAKNSDISIKEMTISGSSVFSIINGFTAGETLTIPKDQTRQVTVRFTPTDSSMVFAILNITSNACFGNELYISGGFPNKAPSSKTLVLTYPNSGETLIAGDTAGITWKGLLPTDVVQLQYSVNNGAVWDTLAQDVTGLRYLWNVPLEKGFSQKTGSAISNSCLARIIQLWPNNIGQTLDFPHKNTVLSANFSPSEGAYILTTSSDGTVKMWNSYTGAVVMTYSIPKFDALPTWANFNSAEDKIAVSYGDGTVAIFDAASGELLKRIKAHSDIANRVNFNHAGTKIVTCGYDEKLNVWDVETGNNLLTYNNGTKIWDCHFLNDDNRIIFSDNKGKVKIINSTSQNIEKEFYNSDYKMKISNVAVNSDETYIATAQMDGNASIWDVNSGERIKQVSHGRDYVINHVAFGINYSNNQQLLITACNDYTARTWSVPTGDSVAVLKEHNNTVTMASFNFDGTRILTASMDSTAKVWNLNKRDLQIDTTDRTFSIVKAELNTFPIRIDTTAIDETRYAKIDSVMQNKLKGAFNISEMYIDGTNAADFKITDGNAPFRIDTGEVRSVMIAFSPGAVGERKAVLNVVIPYDTVKIPLSGVGKEAGIQLMAAAIDFGNVDLGDFKDTTVTAILKNRTSQKVTFSSVKNVGPVSDAFEVLSNFENVTVEPWSSLPITVRFYAENPGFQQGILQFDYNFEGSPAKLSLYGTGVAPEIGSAVISMTDCSAKAGDEIDVPIMLAKEREFSTNAAGIATEITFNPSVLEVLDKSLKIDVINKKEAKLYLSIPTNFTSGEIYKLKFRAGLGNDTISPLAFSNSAVIGNAKIELKSNNAVFKLNGVCSEGGARLIDTYSKTFLASAVPNPASITTKISFELAVESDVELYISDILGNRVKTVANGRFSNGVHSVDVNLADLNPGKYFYTIRLPFYSLTRELEIVR